MTQLQYFQLKVLQCSNTDWVDTPKKVLSLMLFVTYCSNPWALFFTLKVC